MTQKTPPETSRLDRWLWCVRVYATRGLATTACREGRVTTRGVAAKPARDVRAGDHIEVQQGMMRRTFEVVGVPPSRVGAPRVAEFAVETTPPEEFVKARAARVLHALAETRSGGRPTKRDRRDWARLVDRA